MNAAVEQFVPNVVFGVVPKGIEEIESIEFAKGGGNGGFHAASVVAPNDNAALLTGFVATETKGGIVGVKLCSENVATTDGLNEVANFEEHDVAIPKTPGRVFAIMSIFLADVEHMMCGGEFIHHTNGVFVAGIRQLSSVEYADDGDVVAFDGAIDGESVIGA